MSGEKHFVDDMKGMTAVEASCDYESDRAQEAAATMEPEDERQRKREGAAFQNIERAIQKANAEGRRTAVVLIAEEGEVTRKRFNALEMLFMLVVGAAPAYSWGYCVYDHGLVHVIGLGAIGFLLGFLVSILPLMSRESERLWEFHGLAKKVVDHCRERGFKVAVHWNLEQRSVAIKW